jgi:hypothetical protein
MKLGFVKVAEVDPGPFDYGSDSAWHDYWDAVADAISEHDPWLLLGHKPNTGVVVVDVHRGWDLTLRRLNLRRVELFRLAEENPQ